MRKIKNKQGSQYELIMLATEHLPASLRSKVRAEINRIERKTGHIFKNGNCRFNTAIIMNNTKMPFRYQEGYFGAGIRPTLHAWLSIDEHRVDLTPCYSSFPTTSPGFYPEKEGLLLDLSLQDFAEMPRYKGQKWLNQEVPCLDRVFFPPARKSASSQMRRFYMPNHPNRDVFIERIQKEKELIPLNRLFTYRLLWTAFEGKLSSHNKECPLFEGVKSRCPESDRTIKRDYRFDSIIPHTFQLKHVAKEELEKGEFDFKRDIFWLGELSYCFADGHFEDGVMNQLVEDNKMLAEHGLPLLHNPAQERSAA